MDCSFDLLEDGTAKKVSAKNHTCVALFYYSCSTQLSTQLLRTSTHFLTTLRALIQTHNIPAHLISLPPHIASPPPANPMPTLTPILAHLPSPIIPVLTSVPRPLSAYLRQKGMNARPITWPTVPKGRDRIRVCLHHGNTVEDVEKLAVSMIEWAREQMRHERLTESVVAPRFPRLAIQPKL